MFFIGIFGIRNKTKTIAVRQGEICPVCQALDQLKVVKKYEYFHFFFIPLWRWNVRYLIRTRCCVQTRGLPLQLGEKIERGEEVDWGKFKPTAPIKRCPQCFGPLKDEYKYCPHCGEKTF